MNTSNPRIHISIGSETMVPILKILILRIEGGKHWIGEVNSSITRIAKSGGKPKTFWTKKGVIRLGFFIKSDKARQFRDWAEDM